VKKKYMVSWPNNKMLHTADSYREPRQKVFCIGWQKTGTTTLMECLRELGMRISMHPTGGVKRRDLVREVLTGRYEQAIASARKKDAHRNWPWPLMYEVLDETFPDSKFILSLRSNEGFVRSLTQSKGSGFGRTDWLIYKVATPIGNEETCLKMFAEHNARVMRYFRNRPQDLLVLDFEKSARWEEICEFLDKPVPLKPFPHLKPGRCS
jgi:hypothetical protein